MALPPGNGLYRVGIVPTFLPYLLKAYHNPEKNRWELTVDTDSMMFTIDDADALHRIMVRGKPTGFTAADITPF